MKQKKSKLSQTFAGIRRRMPGLFLLSAASNLLLLTSSVYMLQVFDRVLSSGSVDTLIWLSVIAFFALVAYGFIEYARRGVLLRTSSWLENELAPDVIQRSIQMRLSKGQSVAGLGEVNDCKTFVAGEALLVFLDAPWTPVFILVIWLMHPLLGVIALAAAIVLFLVAVINDVTTRKIQASTAHALRKSRQSAEQFVENAETLSALGMSGAIAQRWHAHHREAESRSTVAADISSVLFNGAKALRLGVQIAILGAGAWLVLRAELTAGGMIAASIILARALAPVERAISAWRSFGSFRSSYGRLKSLYALTQGAVDRVKLPTPKGSLALENVRFFASGSGEPILKSISFSLEPGEVCGIVGSSGAGKSTLCKLLVGAWNPSFGTVRLDGADVADWDSEDLGKYIGYLPQDVELFSGTVSENIARMGVPNDEEIVRAARMAGAHEMILKLPNGYETEIGDYADRLSGGQKQRIGLARALYGDPSLLVLDEPNANLDGNGEIALQTAIRSLKESGRTVVFVTHHPSLLRLTDKVMVISQGVVSKFGPRDAVIGELKAAAPRRGTQGQRLKVAD
jgi:PrtD family type I secretion system ABC transporter